MSTSSQISAGGAAYKLSMNDSDFQEGMNAAQAKMNSVAASAAKTGKGISGFFDNIATHSRKIQMENRSSGQNAFENVLKGGVGGLANVGLDLLGVGTVGIAADMLGKGLNSAVLKATELVHRFDEGKVTLGGMALELAEGLPILGGFVSAAANFFKLVSGAVDEEKRLAAVAKTVADQQKQITEAVAASKQGTIEWTNEMRKLQGELKLLSVAPGSRGVEGEKQALQDKIADLERKRDLAAGVTSPNGGPGDLLKGRAELAGARGALGAAQAKRNALLEKGLSGGGLTTGDKMQAEILDSQIDSLTQIVQSMEARQMVLQRIAGQAEQQFKAQKSLAEQIADIKLDTALADRAKEVERGMATAAQKSNDAADRELKDRADAAAEALDIATRAADAQIELAIITSQQEGRVLEAQLMQLQKNWDDRIKTAKSGAEREAMEKSKALQMRGTATEGIGDMIGAGIRQGAGAIHQNLSNFRTSTTFGTFSAAAATAAGGMGGGRGVDEATKETAKNTLQTVKILKDVLAAVAQGGPTFK